VVPELKKSPTPDEIQKSKVKHQNEKAKLKTFGL